MTQIVKTEDDAQAHAATLSDDDRGVFLEYWAKKEWRVLIGHFRSFFGVPDDHTLAAHDDGTVHATPPAAAAPAEPPAA